MYKAKDNNQMPPPLECFKKSFTELKLHTNSNDKISSSSMATNSCMRDMYHYVHVSELHILECVMDTTLSIIKREHASTSQQCSYTISTASAIGSCHGLGSSGGKNSRKKEIDAASVDK